MDHIRVPALEHDKWHITINEVIAHKLEDKGIELVFQLLEQ